MKRFALSIGLVGLFAGSAAFCLPTGEVSQLEPTESKAYGMALQENIVLDRFVQGSNHSFYANSADYIVDGQLLTSDEYYRNYIGESYCQIKVFDATARGPKVIAAGTLQSQIDSTVETKDSNWKDGAYNWSSLSSNDTKSGPYIASVSCHIEGSQNAQKSPPVSIEKMQEMLDGVVTLFEIY